MCTAPFIQWGCGGGDRTNERGWILPFLISLPILLPVSSCASSCNPCMPHPMPPPTHFFLGLCSCWRWSHANIAWALICQRRAAVSKVGSIGAVNQAWRLGWLSLVLGIWQGSGCWRWLCCSFRWHSGCQRWLECRFGVVWVVCHSFWGFDGFHGIEGGSLTVSTVSACWHGTAVGGDGGGGSLASISQLLTRMGRWCGRWTGGGWWSGGGKQRRERVGLT